MTAAIDPARWARMSWYARQQWQAAQAREARRVAALRANVEAARAEHVAHYGTDDDTVPEPAQTGDERMDQIIDMLNCGYLPAEIADRLGIKAGSVAMWLRRHGRPDLALPFEDQRNHEERHPCPDCGQMCARNRRRCYPCAMKARDADERYQTAWRLGMARRNAAAVARFKGRAAS